MNKQQEVAALDKFVASLPVQSYLGLWLADARLGIATDISNDIIPEVVMPAAAKRAATEVMTQARTDADAILAKARTQAEEIVAAARRHAETTRQQVIRDLHKAIAAV